MLVKIGFMREKRVSKEILLVLIWGTDFLAAYKKKLKTNLKTRLKASLGIVL